MLLTRSMTPETEGGLQPEPDWVVVVQLKLDDLLIEDKTSAVASVKVEPAAPDPDLLADEVRHSSLIR